MSKEFDIWNKKKKYLNNIKFENFYYERDVWWCSLGFNIGSEQNGKNEMFERPVIILKKHGKDVALIAPITSVHKANYDRILLNVLNKNSDVLLSQIRTISTKRLLRKIGVIPKEDYFKILIRIVNILTKSETTP